MFALVAISGGLFLAGIEGSYKITAIDPPSGAGIDITSAGLEEEVKALLKDAGINHSFKTLQIKQTAAAPVSETTPEGASPTEHQEEEQATHDHDHDHHDSPDPAESHDEGEEQKGSIPQVTTLTTQPVYKTHFRVTLNPGGDIAIEKTFSRPTKKTHRPAQGRSASSLQVPSVCHGSWPSMRTCTWPVHGIEQQATAKAHRGRRRHRTGPVPGSRRGDVIRS